MTNPTTNFGWVMPSPTDLVTDLPADFEVFGQAVDTDFVDLLGGANGYILSKASATDLDFAWIPNDQGDITAVTVTAPITGGGTSGSVGIAISAATTSASGAVQLSDSISTTSSVLASTPTATKSAYDLAASAYAPAFTNNFYAGKNKIINGDFSVNQRGFTTDTVGAYCFDRWQIALSGGTCTYTAQTFTPGTAPVAGYEGKNFLRLTTTVGNDFLRAAQSIESVRTFAGQTVVLSFWAKGTNPSSPGYLAVMIQQQFGTGGSPSASVTSADQNFTLTANWTRYSFTFNVPSIAGKTLGTAGNDKLDINIGQITNASTNAWTLDLWGVQLEAASTGSTATPFQTASGSIAGELALCQRYYYRNTGLQSFSRLASGVGTLTTNAQIVVNLPVTMRTSPASVDSSTLLLYDGVTATNITTITLVSNGISPDVAAIDCAVASGLTQFRPYLLANQSTSSYLGFSSEL